METRRPRWMQMELRADGAAAPGVDQQTLHFRNVAPELSELGTARASFLFLTELVALPAAEPTAAGAAGRTVLLERCRPSSRAGFAAFCSSKSGVAPVTGIVAVRSVYPDGRWEYAFNRWYNQHIPQVLGRGMFHTAYRYRALEPEADGSRLHWAFYETDIADIAGTLPAYVGEARRRERAAPGFYPPYVNVLGSGIFARLPAATA
jgi:hypothetical protein